MSETGTAHSTPCRACNTSVALYREDPVGSASARIADSILSSTVLGAVTVLGAIEARVVRGLWGTMGYS